MMSVSPRGTAAATTPVSGTPDTAYQAGRPAGSVRAAAILACRHSPRWRVEKVAYDRIDRRLVASHEELFYLLASASFIETGSDMYTRNLAEHYADHPEVAAWLREQWEREELQHGRALELYVKAVWPDFPWQRAYDGFFAEYAGLCTMEALESNRALEMVARCVVETGTTTYYQTLRDLSPEPVLSELLGHIRADEVSHFKHFLAYFKQLQAARPMSRARVARVLYVRLQELRESDSDVALRHVWAHKGTLFAAGAASFDDISQRIYRLVSRRLPADQAVRMLLKPLMLPHRLEKWLQTPLSRLARRVIAA